VAQDPIQALMWLRLAAVRFPAGGEDNRKVMELMNEVAARMTPAQSKEAERRVGEWQPTQ
jgi:hypothetical protein